MGKVAHGLLGAENIDQPERGGFPFTLYSANPQTTNPNHPLRVT